MVKTQFKENVQIVQTARNVIVVYVDNVSTGFSLPILLRSDAHHDSKYCDKKTEKSQLDEAIDRKAIIMDFGDLHDGMQGREDPRRTATGLTDEYRVDNYFDKLVTEAAEFYGTYAKNWLLMSQGNHEMSILKHNGIDMTSNTIHRLNSDFGGHVIKGHYGGYVRILFNSGKTQTKVIKYFHGAQTGMSRGNINKQATMYPDADIIINGHGHDAMHLPIARERLSERGVVYTDVQHHIRTTTYQNEYEDGATGHWVEKGNTPRPIGATWLEFVYRNQKIEVNVTHAVR